MIESLYVHIPFCKQKCLYCDFNSFKGKENLIELYMEALYKECASFSFKSLKTIYIGGGTPSFIDSKYIKKLLLVLPKADEVTIEMNPCTVTKEKLLDYKIAGVNRVSMGLQTTNDDILKKIGRVHTLEDFENAYRLIKEVGFENINADLMFGLPNQTIDDLQKSLDYLLEKNPPHISCYSLILHSEIFENLPSDDDERSMYYLTKETLEKNGYVHYEISNFAKKGFESKHNLACWNQNEYIGIGAGASSYVDGVRYTNEENIETYISKINCEEDIRNIEEVQDDDDKFREYMILKLRTIEGINIEVANDKFDMEIRFKNEIEKMIRLNLLEIKEGYLRLTNEGLDFANVVWEEFV